MDSITQIVLGAACGEAVLGKKIGNRALLFGAIGGTIPDLDVFIGKWLFNNEIDAMAFHRGFMHSFLFAILAAVGFGMLVFWIYNRGKRFGMTTQKEWMWLFFASIFTHPILDSFTAYGTQLFAPFSNYRVAFNNISVADPMYTLPFLIALIVVMCFKRTSTKRRLFLQIGLGVSSLYMVLTLVNKYHVNGVYKQSLADQKIEYLRFQTQPTILNNILWYGTAETTEAYYVGFYSILDAEATVSKWHKLPKNHELIGGMPKDLETLAWFSSGFYNLNETADPNTFLFKDLRYPLMDESDPNSSVFKFTITKKGDRWEAAPFYASDVSSDALDSFWTRLKGI
ncbi:MAG: metal-dependent hydrolase [Flavobacteriaceae bacterium]|jgi:inner membrane protein|nr:metal-dependent hydrolase [Flavobacteriaceae bacterium]